ncbi:MAG: restriction endonuclease [Methylobacter sp.]|jgi:restriction system protein|uniref:restriction endonuclease n=1 Tax=Methylobacter sp. TaxID=2051955 RepID=UPI0025CD0301|nr:restriction endonuclease [Methylobacter sp.]MCK9620561.1 restriction endonuclease [Methylobacter sp.]
MNWIKNWIYGNEPPAKQATPQPSKENLQTRHLRDGLAFVKQQKNCLASNEVPAKKAAPQQDPQARYLRDTLAFAKQQRDELHHKQNEHERWQRHYGSLHVDELKKLSGTEFEDYLAELFKSQCYQVEMTPLTGDYGADLILHKDQQRTAVQAKCYAGSVGVAAVQEALSGMAYYRCHSAWVVTTGSYTSNAIELARQSNVYLIGQKELGKLILQMQNGR